MVQTLQLSTDRDHQDLVGDLSVCLDGMTVDPEMFSSAEASRQGESVLGHVLKGQFTAGARLKGTVHSNDTSLFLRYVQWGVPVQWRSTWCQVGKERRMGVASITFECFEFRALFVYA